MVILKLIHPKKTELAARAGNPEFGITLSDKTLTEYSGLPWQFLHLLMSRELRVVRTMETF